MLAFNKLGMDKKISYLLHEFIHILQLSKSFFILKKFKEIHELSNILDRIVKNNLTKKYSIFLTGRNLNLGEEKYEIISYLMNDSIDWSAITPQGKKQFIEALRSSRLFNLNSSFWIKRLK